MIQLEQGTHVSSKAFSALSVQFVGHQRWRSCGIGYPHCTTNTTYEFYNVKISVATIYCPVSYAKKKRKLLAKEARSLIVIVTASSGTGIRDVDKIRSKVEGILL